MVFRIFQLLPVGSQNSVGFKPRRAGQGQEEPSKIQLTAKTTPPDLVDVLGWLLLVALLFLLRFLDFVGSISLSCCTRA